MFKILNDEVKSVVLRAFNIQYSTFSIQHFADFREEANFLLLEKITQSLAGRAAILHLLPFSASEIENAGLLGTTLDHVLFKGMYPPLFDRPLAPPDFHPSYIETYLERDVRSMKNIGDLALFRKFVLLCAGRVGQLLNLTSLGNEVGVDHKTIRSWLSVLEASFVVFMLRPYHRN